jgi:hypothetical protein
MVGLASLIGTKPKESVVPAYSGSVRSIGVGVAFEVRPQHAAIELNRSGDVQHAVGLERAAVDERERAQGEGRPSCAGRARFAVADTTPSNRFVGCVAGDRAAAERHRHAGGDRIVVGLGPARDHACGAGAVGGIEGDALAGRAVPVRRGGVVVDGQARQRSRRADRPDDPGRAAAVRRGRPAPSTLPTFDVAAGGLQRGVGAQDQVACVTVPLPSVRPTTCEVKPLAPFSTACGTAAPRRRRHADGEGRVDRSDRQHAAAEIDVPPLSAFVCSVRSVAPSPRAGEGQADP